MKSTHDMITRMTALAAATLLAGLPFSSAQEPAQETDGRQNKEDGRLAWVTAVAYPDDLANPAKIMTGKDITEVTISKRSVGDPVRIGPDGVVRMIREIANEKDPGKPVIETLAQAAIPATVGKALVILVPTVPKQGSTLLFNTHVQDLAGFQGGETLYLNLSPKNMVVELGEQKTPLRKGAVVVAKAERGNKPVNKRIIYRAYNPLNQTWDLVSASTIVVHPTRREICIFSWDPRYEQLDYHGITFPVIE